ncbi:hypothetical protein [Streptomyces javensis]|uniref:Lipoprotein n=1 Tax=Streptomyces javensis TaxID=114698 RepID=A0ABS0R2R5_9ACTN|nr:hypothetical protein [Streptomyces javensis]MBI0311645.1 hypothetical protein [Streptomyces javensis]
MTTRTAITLAAAGTLVAVLVGCDASSGKTDAVPRCQMTHTHSGDLVPTGSRRPCIVPAPRARKPHRNTPGPGQQPGQLGVHDGATAPKGPTPPAKKPPVVKKPEVPKPPKAPAAPVRRFR